MVWINLSIYGTCLSLLKVLSLILMNLSPSHRGSNLFLALQSVMQNPFWEYRYLSRHKDARITSLLIFGIKLVVTNLRVFFSGIKNETFLQT